MSIPAHRSRTRRCCSSTSNSKSEEYEVERVSGELFVSAVIHPLPSDLEESLGESWADLPAELSAKALYSPQHDYPDLFLRFARLVGQNGSQSEDDMLETALGWIQTYGVLGVEGVDPLAYRGKQRAGRRESVAAFAREATKATSVLDAFEAANSGDPERMRDLLRRRLRVALGWSPERMKAMLFAHVADAVNEYLERYCFPRVFNEHLFSSTPTQDISQGWESRSLLGAMYLQMMFYAQEPPAMQS